MTEDLKPEKVRARRVAPTDAECKAAFLDAAGITDQSPYENMDTRATIEVILRNSDLTYSKIAERMAITQQAVSNSALRAARSLSTAANLGRKIKPFLDEAAQEGRIKRATGKLTPEWEAQQQQAKHKEQLSLVNIFCSGIGVDRGEYNDIPIRDILKQWLQNAELYYADAGNEAGYIKNTLRQGKPIYSVFVEKVVQIIKPRLEQGINEGWIDRDTKKPLPFETILHTKLSPYGIVIGDEDKGLDALVSCLDQITGKTASDETTGLPRSSIGPILGHDQNWISLHLDSGTTRRFSPSDIAHIANAVISYLDGRKQWKGVLEFPEGSEFQKNHEVVRDYVIAKLKQAAPASVAEIDEVLRPLPTTLGQTLRKIRESACLSQSAFGDRLSFSELSKLETNCFSPRCIEIIDGEVFPKEALRNKLDVFAERVAAHFSVRNKTPSTELRGTVVLRDIATQELRI